MAAALLARSAVFADTRVTSAGTHAVPGQAACTVAGDIATDDDWARLQWHRSTLLDADGVRAADLVLTAETAQREAASLLDPTARSRTFTLREATALAEVLERNGAPRPSGPAALAAALHGMRGRASPPAAARPSGGKRVSRLFLGRGGAGSVSEPGGASETWDVRDGHGLREREHRASAEAVRAGVEALCAALDRLKPAR